MARSSGEAEKRKRGKTHKQTKRKSGLRRSSEEEKRKLMKSESKYKIKTALVIKIIPSWW